MATQNTYPLLLNMNGQAPDNDIRIVTIAAILAEGTQALVSLDPQQTAVLFTITNNSALSGVAITVPVNIPVPAGTKIYGTTANVSILVYYTKN